MQALPAAPESLCVVEMGGHDVTRDDVEGGYQSGLFLNIGLQVGSTHLLRQIIDCVTFLCLCLVLKVKERLKVIYNSFWATHQIATEHCLLYGITQGDRQSCYSTQVNAPHFSLSQVGQL